MTCNAPDVDLTPEGVALLRDLSRAMFMGSPGRPRKSRTRDELKRRGLIFSCPPNANAIARMVGGYGHRWLLTDAGKALLEYIGEEM